jgi:hypothetical protein
MGVAATVGTVAPMAIPSARPETATFSFVIAILLINNATRFCEPDLRCEGYFTTVLSKLPVREFEEEPPSWPTNASDIASIIRYDELTASDHPVGNLLDGNVKRQINHTA